MVLLDGPMGSRLEERGIDVSAPAWSARALRTDPQAVAALHREYAAAGSQVARANTFRTTRRASGEVGGAGEGRRGEAARGRSGVRVAGSLGPLEDCYRPELSPPARAASTPSSRACSRTRASTFSCVRRFSNPREALQAVEAASRPGSRPGCRLPRGRMGRC